MDIREATKSLKQEPIRLELPEPAPGHLGGFTNRVAWGQRSNDKQIASKWRGVSSMHAQGRKLRLNRLGLTAREIREYRKPSPWAGEG
jgi:hypothetical protein